MQDLHQRSRPSLACRESAHAQQLQRQRAHSHTSSTDSWNSFAKDEPERYEAMAKSASAPSSQRTSPSKEQRQDCLVDVSAVDEMRETVANLTLAPDSTDSQPDHDVSVAASATPRIGGGAPRRKWKSTHTVREQSITVETVKKIDWSQQESLLDMD